MKKLAVEVTETQKDELSKTVAFLEKLLKRKAAIEKKNGSLCATETRVVKEIVELEAKADLGDRKASTELLAASDQLVRLRRSIGYAEQELDALLPDMTRAANLARREIREAHAPLVAEHAESLTALLSPFCESRTQAREQAGGIYSLSQLSAFARPASRGLEFESCADAAAALETLVTLLTALIAGEAVIQAPESEGGFTLPPYCGA